MARQLISRAKGWEGEVDPEINTYIPELIDNANIEEAFKLFMYGNFENGSAYDEKSLYYFLLTFKNQIQSNESAIQGHAAQSSNVHNLGIAGPADSDGGNVVGTTAEQTLENKTLNSPIVNGGTVNATTLQQGGVQAVTTTGVQLLTGKTLTSPSVTGPKINENVILTATSTQLNRVDATSSIQTQLNNRLKTSVVNATIFIQPNQPSSPAIGDIWIDY
jgi:hypothetical protein